MQSNSWIKRIVLTVKSFKPEWSSRACMLHILAFSPVKGHTALGQLAFQLRVPVKWWNRLVQRGRGGRAFCCLHSHLVNDSLCVLAVERGQKISEQIVIGTPGTVLDWCSKLKFIDPKKIKVFVLDEADVMIATQGHQDQSIRIQR